MFVNILLLLAGFVLLIKGADFFVEGASGIANRFGISQIVIGLTVVAFGTSAPEAAISITAAINGNTGIAVGNVLGSNLLNILLILGATALVAPLAVGKNTLRYEIPFVIVITAIVVAIGAIFGEIALVSGIIFVLLLVLFIVYLVLIAKKAENDEDNKPEAPKKERRIWKLMFFTLVGIGAIVLGSDLAIDGATYVAREFGMSDRLIGLTIVALGTSLPELVTSLVAAKKGNADIAIGNNVGSCIFNILFVLGVTAVICPVPFEPKFIIDGIFALGAAVMLLLCVLLNKKKRLGRLGGVLMLAAYAVYYVYLFLV